MKAISPSKFKYTKIFAKFLNPKCVFKKTQIVLILFKASMQKSTQIFFAEIVQAIEIRKSEILSVIALPYLDSFGFYKRGRGGFT